MDDFPRLLVATEFAPGAAGGGPAVIRQMLKDWPHEDLLWWSVLPASSLDEFCVDRHSVAAMPPKLYPHAKFARLKSWLLENLWVPAAASSLRRTIMDLKPEVIWAIPHQWSIPVLSRVLPPAGIPFHVTMQDYPDTRGARQRLGPERAGRFLSQARTLYASAMSRDATSHPMIEDLERVTGKPADQMLHAGLEESDFAALKNAVKERTPSPIRIAYAGTIIVEDVFAAVVTVLRELQQKHGLQFELELFSAHSYASRAWFDAKWMRERGNLPEQNLRQALQTCAWGLAIMDLADDDPQYNRFSFPTKFITYLAVGLPVITVGHRESSLVRLVANHDVGPVIDEAHITEMAAILAAAFASVNPQGRFLPEIIRCGREEFDAERMRGQLYTSFRECVRAG